MFVHHNAVALLAIGMFATSTWAQLPPATVSVRGVGVGADEATATKAALTKAVSAVIETLVEAPTRKKHQATIDQKVLPKAAEMVKNFEVFKTEKVSGGKISVHVKADVDRKAVIDALIEASVLVKEEVAARELVAFCKDNLGKQVGNGECATLAQEAMKTIGAKPFYEYKESPEASDYVWGEAVFVLEFASGKRKRDPTDAKPKPGDVIQYRNATFRGSRITFTYPHHTSVIAEVKPNGDLMVYEQNMNGKKEVMLSTIRPNELVGGWIRVYRPALK